MNFSNDETSNDTIKYHNNNIRQLIIEMKEKPLYLDKIDLMLPDEENGLYKSNIIINNNNINDNDTGLLLGQGVKTQTTLKDVHKSHEKKFYRKGNNSNNMKSSLFPSFFNKLLFKNKNNNYDNTNDYDDDDDDDDENSHHRPPIELQLKVRKQRKQKNDEISNNILNITPLVSSTL